MREDKEDGEKEEGGVEEVEGGEVLVNKTALDLREDIKSRGRLEELEGRGGGRGVLKRRGEGGW